MSAEKEVVYAGDRHYGDKIAKAIDEISEATNAALLKELEATRAELAAERANPKGGVAWALRSRKTRELNRLCLQKTVILYKSKADAERAAKDCGTEWEVITYPLGDGADELKAAIERAEKAKAELAALKAAPAEVPPLDKWRVLATANKIMLREYNNSSHGSANESLCNSVRWALSSILIAERKDREQVYPFKD